MITYKCTFISFITKLPQKLSFFLYMFTSLGGVPSRCIFRIKKDHSHTFSRFFFYFHKKKLSCAFLMMTCVKFIQTRYQTDEFLEVWTVYHRCQQRSLVMHGQKVKRVFEKNISELFNNRTGTFVTQFKIRLRILHKKFPKMYP